MNKYKAIKTVVDGITFDSKSEAKRYGELKQLERGGKIFDLEIQPRFPCFVNGIKVCDYYGDFAYFEQPRTQRVVEDRKSAITRKNPVYRLKKKLVEALYSITIQEV